MQWNSEDLETHPRLLASRKVGSVEFALTEHQHEEGIPFLALISFLYGSKAGLRNKYKSHIAVKLAYWVTRFVVLMFQTSCTILSASMFLFVLCNDQGFTRILTSGNLFIQVVPAFIAHILVIVKSKSLEDLPQEMIAWAVRNASSHSARQFKKTAKIYGAAAITFTIIVTVIKCIIFNKYLKRIVAVSAPLNYTAATDKLYRGIAMFMYYYGGLYAINLSSVAFNVILIGGFVLICALLRANLSRMQEMSTVPTIQRNAMDILLKSQSRHRLLCKQVLKANAVYSPLLLLWYFMQMFTMCFNLRLLIVQDRARSIYGQIDVGLTICITLVTFFGVSLAGATVNSMVMSTIPKHTSMNTRYFHLRWLKQHPGIENENMMNLRRLHYKAEVDQHKVHFNGCGFFTINHSTIVAVAGTVLTYTLVLYKV